MKPNIIYKVKGFRRERDMFGGYQLKVEQFYYYDKDKAQTKFIELSESGLYYKTEYNRIDRKLSKESK